MGPFTTASSTSGMNVLAATARLAQTSITSIWREYGRTKLRSLHKDPYVPARGRDGIQVMSGDGSDPGGEIVRIPAFQWFFTRTSTLIVGARPRASEVAVNGAMFKEVILPAWEQGKNDPEVSMTITGQPVDAASAAIPSPGRDRRPAGRRADTRGLERLAWSRQS